MNAQHNHSDSRDQQGSPPQRRVIQIESLLQGARELHIVHNQHRYQLKVTQSGKLILNK